MNTVPLLATPSQTLNVTLGGQACTIAVYQKSTGVFLDLSIAGAIKMSCVICRDRVRLAREAYVGLVGDLCFVDTQGASDPDYTGFGSRYLLVYLALGDVA